MTTQMLNSKSIPGPASGQETATRSSAVASHGVSLPPLRRLTPPDIALPDGAVDCHAHVIDPDKFPVQAGGSYKPAKADADAYLDMLQQTGMSHGVLVQTSIYGTDNSCMLDLLSRRPGQLRGVAVVDAAVTPNELARLHAAGVRGVRFNAMFNGGTPLAAIPEIADKIASLGWHIELLVDCASLPGMTPMLKNLPLPVVLAHVGYQRVESRQRTRGFDAMLALYDDERFWIKLSGFNRLVGEDDSYPEVVPLLREVIAISSERIVWGSDWPHVACRTAPDTGQLLNTLLSALDPGRNPALLHRVFVDNPSRLYGFNHPII